MKIQKSFFQKIKSEKGSTNILLALTVTLGVGTMMAPLAQQNSFMAQQAFINKQRLEALEDMETMGKIVQQGFFAAQMSLSPSSTVVDCGNTSLSDFSKKGSRSLCISQNSLCLDKVRNGTGERVCARNPEVAFAQQAMPLNIYVQKLFEDRSNSQWPRDEGGGYEDHNQRDYRRWISPKDENPLRSKEVFQKRFSLMIEEQINKALRQKNRESSPLAEIRFSTEGKNLVLTLPSFKEDSILEKLARSIHLSPGAVSSFASLDKAQAAFASQPQGPSFVSTDENINAPSATVLLNPQVNPPVGSPTGPNMANRPSDLRINCANANFTCVTIRVCPQMYTQAQCDTRGLHMTQKYAFYYRIVAALN